MDRSHREDAAEFLVVRQMDRKIFATIQAVLVFYIISHPVVYRMTNRILGGLATASGCPTSLGLIVHALVFGAVVYGLMNV